MTAAAHALKLESIQTRYGRSQVLFDVSLELKEGQVVALLGRNGMGKTTTVRSIMSLTAPFAGDVLFHGRRINGLAPFQIARLGVGLVPEGRQVFPNLSVEENLVALARRSEDESDWSLAQVLDLFPHLAQRANNMGNQLSGGEQQMLALGRALMTSPKLLILDEATEGLAPLIRLEIWRVLELLKARGMTILVIDKNLSDLSRISDRMYILEKGRTVWDGTPGALNDSADIQQRYLGI